MTCYSLKPCHALPVGAGGVRETKNQEQKARFIVIKYYTYKKFKNINIHNKTDNDPTLPARLHSKSFASLYPHNSGIIIFIFHEQLVKSCG